ncbi:hypothetical protein HGRIS_000799 [Hohenbuehelia grisea]|uniref:Uncharacterized protein n=1 Tax=Hohenbuehelia grisea TaxID=104357 RepID=A0ABR3IPS2_9AGAR
MTGGPFVMSDSLDSSIPPSYSTPQASTTKILEDTLANNKDSVPHTAPPGIHELVVPPRESSIVSQIRDGELTIRLENPKEIDQDFHSSELEKLERLCESCDIERLVVEAHPTPEEAEYAIKLFNEASRAALQFSGPLREIKLILPPTIPLIRTDRCHVHAPAQVFPWWHLPKHGLSTVTKLTIKYPIPIDECIDLLGLCPDLRHLDVGPIVSPSQVGLLNSRERIYFTNIRSMMVRTAVGLSQFYHILNVPTLQARGMVLTFQASPRL